MKKWRIVLLALVFVLLAAWYAFRPEGFFINTSVHEEMPTVGGGPSAQNLASGTFHSIAHPAKRTATIYRRGDGKWILR